MAMFNSYVKLPEGKPSFFAGQMAFCLGKPQAEAKKAELAAAEKAAAGKAAAVEVGIHRSWWSNWIPQDHVEYVNIRYHQWSNLDCI